MTNEPLSASVTLEEIVMVVTQKRAPLAPELAGYLVLELAENASAARGEIDMRSVYVSEEGSVALVRSGAEGGDAEGALRSLLGKLLEAAGAQTPALANVARRKGGEGVPSLVEEIEAALVPVNRSAGKRALARLARETKRITDRVGRHKSAPNIEADGDAPASSSRPKALAKPDTKTETPTMGLSHDELAAAVSKAKRDSVDSLLDSFEASGKMGDKALSRELKAMAGLEPTPPPPGPTSSAELDALLQTETVKKDTGRETPISRRPPPPRAPSPSYADERQATTSPSEVRKLKEAEDVLKRAARKRSRGPSNAVLFLLVVVLFGLLAAVLWKMQPVFLTGRTPEVIARERAAAEAESAKRAAAANAQLACHTTLVVTGAPNNAEILVREGQSPVDIDHMPVGTRLELIATAEGYAPKRGIITPDMTWGNVDGKPHLDLPIQLDKSRARPGAVDPWPAGEPDTQTGGDKAAPGTVHVIASPKGAEVWLLAGLGEEAKRGEPPPEATLEDVVACDADADILVAGPTTYRKRLHVPSSSFVLDAATKVRVAHLVVK